MHADGSVVFDLLRDSLLLGVFGNGFGLGLASCRLTWLNLLRHFFLGAIVLCNHLNSLVLILIRRNEEAVILLGRLGLAGWLNVHLWGRSTRLLRHLGWVGLILAVVEGRAVSVHVLVTLFADHFLGRWIVIEDVFIVLDGQRLALQHGAGFAPVFDFFRSIVDVDESL